MMQKAMQFKEAVAIVNVVILHMTQDYLVEYGVAGCQTRSTQHNLASREAVTNAVKIKINVATYKQHYHNIWWLSLCYKVVLQVLKLIYMEIHHYTRYH